MAFALYTYGLPTPIEYSADPLPSFSVASACADGCSGVGTAIHAVPFQRAIAPPVRNDPSPYNAGPDPSSNTANDNSRSAPAPTALQCMPFQRAIPSTGMPPADPKMPPTYSA